MLRFWKFRGRFGIFEGVGFVAHDVARNRVAKRSQIRVNVFRCFGLSGVCFRLLCVFGFARRLQALKLLLVLQQLAGQDVLRSDRGCRMPEHRFSMCESVRT